MELSKRTYRQCKKSLPTSYNDHTAYFSLFGTPIDSRLTGAFNQEVETFHKAAGLFSPAIEILEMPFGNHSLPAYFIKVDDLGKPANSNTYQWL